MPLIPNFNTGQTVGSPSVLNIIDTSTGSDVLITSRQVSLQTASGGYLVPDGNPSSQYISWALANNSISINVLQNDMALYVTVNWLDVGGAVLYTKTTLIATTLYGEQFAFNLCQNESSDPTILADQNYLMNAFRLRLNIDNANNAVAIGGNIFTSQSQLNKEAYLIANANLFF